MGGWVDGWMGGWVRRERVERGWMIEWAATRTRGRLAGGLEMCVRERGI